MADNSVEQPSACIICEGKNRPYWAGSMRCTECGLVTKDPFPSEAELLALYRTSWAAPIQHSAETGDTDSDYANELAAHLEHHLDQPLAGLHLLDFGAGRGTFSRALERRGADVTSYEPFGADHLAAAEVRTFDDRDAITSTFDGVVAIEVIEHLRDPLEFAAWAHAHLSPGGWLFLTTPRANGLNARIRKEEWREFTKPGHIALFDARSIRSLLLAAGFTTTECVRWHIHAPPLVKQTLGVFTTVMGLHGALRVIAVRD